MVEAELRDIMIKVCEIRVNDIVKDIFLRALKKKKEKTYDKDRKIMISWHMPLWAYVRRPQLISWAKYPVHGALI